MQWLSAATRRSFSGQYRGCRKGRGNAKRSLWLAARGRHLFFFFLSCPVPCVGFSMTCRVGLWVLRVRLHAERMARAPNRRGKLAEGRLFPVRAAPHSPCSLPPHPFSVLQTGKRVGKVLHASLQSVLHKEESLGPKRQRVGFLG